MYPISPPGCPCPSSPVNGYTRYCSVYRPYYNYVYYYCNSGYHLHGNSYRRCLPYGTWYGRAPACLEGKETTCFLYITLLCYYCNSIIMSNITNSGTPCQCPPAPANGSRSYCSGTASVGTNLYYYCNSGYYRDGSNYARCLPFGNWTETPTCKKSELIIIGLLIFIHATS